MKLFVGALLGTTLVISPVSAKNGTDLLKQCKEAKHFLQAGKMNNTKSLRDNYTYGTGYCTGLLVGLSVASNLPEENGDTGTFNKYYCLPGNVSMRRMVSDVVNYLEKNPNELHKGDIQLAVNALMATYSCKK